MSQKRKLWIWNSIALLHPQLDSPPQLRSQYIVQLCKNLIRPWLWAFAEFVSVKWPMKFVWVRVKTLLWLLSQDQFSLFMVFQGWGSSRKPKTHILSLHENSYTYVCVCLFAQMKCRSTVTASVLVQVLTVTVSDTLTEMLGQFRHGSTGLPKITSTRVVFNTDLWETQLYMVYLNIPTLQ